MPRRLSPVQKKENASRPADLSHSPGVLHRAADIGAVGQHHQPGVGPEQPGHRIQSEPPLAVTGNPVEDHPGLGQGLEGPHDGVVLHGGDQAVVSRPQQPPNDQVQPPGGSGGENAAGGIRVIE